jgi:hypothetical protein
MFQDTIFHVRHRLDPFFATHAVPNDVVELDDRASLKIATCVQISCIIRTGNVLLSPLDPF